MYTVADYYKVRRNKVRFCFDGHRLSGHKTFEEQGVGDEDEIVVVPELHGC